MASFWDSISSALGSVGDVLGSSALQGALSLGMAGLEGYTGLSQLSDASALSGLSQDALQQQLALAYSNEKKYNQLYLPIEQAQAQYALQDLTTMRPLQEAQLNYGVERGLYDIARAQNFYQPLEESLTNQLAQGVNAQDYMNTASTDVQNAFSKARQQQARTLASAGVNPNSAAYQRQLQSNFTSQALGEAGARTSARQTAEDLDLSRKAAALQYAAGIPIDTTNAINGSALLGQAASGLSNVASTATKSVSDLYGTAGDLLASSKYNLSNVSNYWGS